MVMDPVLIYGKLTRYCAYAERCKKDVFQKMKLLAVEPEDQQAFIDRLINDLYLNETRYVKNFIKSHSGNKKWGKVKMKTALLRKGIASDLILEHLAAVETENYRENIKILIERKLKSVKAKTPSELKQKLFRFLMARGFESSEISMVLKEMNF